MNPGGREHPDDQLEAYLDGQLAGAELIAFEARVARDSTLSADVEMQRRMDRSLGTLFLIPPMIGLPTNGHPKHLPDAKTASRPHLSLPARKLLLGGLTALVGVLAVWLGYLFFFADHWKSFADIYREEANAARVSPNSAGINSLGGGLELKQNDPGIRVTAVRQAPVLSRNTVIYRALVDGQVVVLLADSMKHDNGQVAREAGSCEVHVFHKQLGDIVLYEMTPLEKPRVLDQVALAPVPGCAVETTRPSSQKSP